MFQSGPVVFRGSQPPEWLHDFQRRPFNQAQKGLDFSPGKEASWMCGFLLPPPPKQRTHASIQNEAHSTPKKPPTKPSFQKTCKLNPRPEVEEFEDQDTEDCWKLEGQAPKFELGSSANPPNVQRLCEPFQDRVNPQAMF